MAASGTKTFSSIQERRVAEYLGWQVVRGSGARNCFPGDVKAEGWLGECKTHTSPGHKLSFSRAVWKKIQDEAKSRFSAPAYFVDDGSQLVDHTWVMYLPHSITTPVHLLEFSLPAVTRASFTVSREQLELTYVHAMKTQSSSVPTMVFKIQFGDEFVMLSNIAVFKFVCLSGR